jgi:hypothetical protein
MLCELTKKVSSFRREIYKLSPFQLRNADLC